MLPAWVLFATALSYLLFLFAIASYGDRKSGRAIASGVPRPVIYSLSLCIYCTSGTYLGAVGLATQHGLEFLGIYIGPVIMFTLGMPILRRIVGLAKAERLTSIADFVSARYGKSPVVAALIAIVAVLGTIPYIALQLKAVSDSVATLVTGSVAKPGGVHSFFSDISFVVTIGLALFAVIFGTRHTDATEHQNGLILAIATESLVKLLAITTVGLVVIFGIFGGFGDLVQAAKSSPDIMMRLAYQTPLARWIVLTVLSAFAILMLPRQFHVTVVENRSPRELRLAGFLFPLYLVAINLFVIPVAIAGLSTFGGAGERDLYVLTVPLAHGLPIVTVAAFLGGFSAATAMVIVASVAVSIMISNDIIMPLFLRPNVVRRGAVPGDFGATILMIRRTAIFFVMLLGYAYYSMADLDAGLASIGLLSFAAIAQFAPALFGGLVWRQANSRGAIAGIIGGMLVWGGLLFVPSLGGPDIENGAAAVLDFITPGPAWASGPTGDPLVNTVILSLVVNTLLFITGSLSRAPRPLERMQADVFIPERPLARPPAGRWRTTVTVEELEQTVARYLGPARTRRSFRNYESTSGKHLIASDPADMGLARVAEQLLGSAVGTASARLVLSLLFQKTGDTSAETARLLDQASEALQYNHDLLETALGQMDQGISVFDGSRRLTVWNRRFRTLLDLPETVGQVGYSLDDIVSILTERGDIEADGRDRFVKAMLTMDKAFQLTVKAK
ncbi:MAG TPA: PAS-domain containing protein, partial [Pararhizobium sp.]|nr:PAS-domain containing protein [Pararhizobium sp.]